MRNIGKTWGLFLTMLGLAVIGASNQSFAQGDTWETKERMPIATNGSAGVLNGRLHVVGSLNHLAYDPAGDTWETRAAPLFNHGGDVAVASIANKLYIVGGCLNGDCASVTGILEVYDPTTNEWTQKATMPTPRGLLDAAVIDGKLYVVGGMSSGFSQQFAKLEVYDPATDTWDTTRASMPTAREGMKAAAIGGKLYVVGGFVRIFPPVPPFGFDTGVLEVYDPVTDTWDTTRAPMPTARHLFGVGVINGQLHAVGGNSSATGHTGIHEAYDPVSDAWTTKASMPTPRAFPATAVIDSKLYAAGGFRCVTGLGCGFIDALEVYTPAVTPEQAVQNLIDDINALGLPGGVQTSLTGPLNQVVDILNDNNPNNDAAACGKLGAFVNQVNAKEKSGQLTAGEADGLRQLAEAIEASLGCP